MNYSKKPICLPSSSLIPFLTSVLVIYLITTSVSPSNSRNESDHLALLSFKSMITHDPFGALSSWNTSIHFCNWSGVSCGKRHRRVSVLNIESQGLTGSLSPHVGNLSFLRRISLWNNSFHGTIPCEIGRLSRLRFLQFAHNKFGGVIPSNVSHCSNLKKVSLAYNKLVGSIPKEINYLSKLTYLSVQYNKLTGGIPPSLGNITSMETFSVVANPLGGNIPDTLGRWKSLREFYLSGCHLYGTIPDSIYNLSLLANFSLSSNQLTGSLPSLIGAMLPHLEILELSENQLSGQLPPSISNCSKLRFLEIAENSVSGKLRMDFAKLRDINAIVLGGNFFESGEADGIKFVDYMQNCSRLEILDLADCKFQGVLPRSIGNLSNQLNFLSLGNNQLHGNLPSSIGNLVSLTALGVAGNRFTGKIPSTIGKLQNLQVASLAVNQFSGPIPDAMGNLSLLIKLHLFSNKLEGHIPSSLGNCRHLLELYLGKNKLSGTIPKKLLQISSLSIALDLSQNNLHGSLPTEIEDLKMLASLDLSHNNLSGNIPSTLSGCTSLSLLFFNGNSFYGMIPTSLRSLRGLVELDLSNNNLSGQIPPFLEQLSLHYLNLSFNEFEGEVPMVGVFANSSALSVLGNSKLCGGLVELGLPKCKKTAKHKKRFPLFVIVILIASTLFTVLCLMYAWHKKRRSSQRSHSTTNERFPKVSYSQLFKATNGFAETNLIGEGGSSSVYKGILNHDDRVVAVKVIHLQKRGGHKSFTRECEALRSIRHRNLLKIITACSSVDFKGNDFKALVYEFMPNGSLHDWLHSRENTSRLNIVQRIHILIDVASALDYLHNHCATAIIHGDLKPGNVLLDDDMVAHVGDFGLARFLGTYSNQTSSSTVGGTIGYAAPEYGVGSEMTSSGDVYSFGILLLEVMTRKKPTDKMFNEDLSLHKFMNMALPDHVTDVVDDDLLYFHQGDEFVMQKTEENARKIEECMASIVKIGVSCSVDSPSQRMNIKNVVLELQRIQHTLQNN